MDTATLIYRSDFFLTSNRYFIMDISKRILHSSSRLLIYLVDPGYQTSSFELKLFLRIFGVMKLRLFWNMKSCYWLGSLPVECISTDPHKNECLQGGILKLDGRGKRGTLNIERGVKLKLNLIKVLIISRGISSQDKSNSVPGVKELLFPHKIFPASLQRRFFRILEPDNFGVVESRPHISASRPQLFLAVTTIETLGSKVGRY